MENNLPRYQIGVRKAASLQILTIADMLNGRLPKLPPTPELAETNARPRRKRSNCSFHSRGCNQTSKG